MGELRDMDLIEEQEVQVDVPPYRLEFRGTVESIGEEPQGVSEDGSIVSWASGAIFEIEDGSICNRDTGDWVNLSPGRYRLDRDGFEKVAA